MDKKIINRKLSGTVVSDKMQKTRVVAVTRLAKHKRYKKYYKVTKRYKAHDQENVYGIGDEVVIQETRPISKEKRWKIVELIRKSPQSQKEEIEK